MGDLVAIIAVIVSAFVLAKLGLRTRRKRIARQYGVPYANDMQRLAERSRRKRVSV